jgi:Flp pilus assembly protein CpaB
VRVSDRTRSIAVALALAVAAAVIITLAVKKTGGSSKPAKGEVSVIVATQDIPTSTPGSELGGKVHTEQVAKDAVVAGAISSRDQVRNLVSTATIFSGEQITIRRFQPQQAEGTQGQITGNLRAVQVPGDPNQLLVNTLKKGDHIDVLASIKYKLVNFRQKAGTSATDAAAQAAQQAEFVASRVVLRNLLVLREPEQPAGAGRIGGSNSTGAYDVLLAVTDTQAQKLFYVLKNADWSFQLRPTHNAVDSPESVDTTGSILSDGLRPPQFFQLVLGAGGS